MNMQRNVKKKPDIDAVSPVIGVMLMIVVTIIIAAIVSAFAGGFSDQQKKTPSAQIEVTLQQATSSSGLATPQLVFTHKGGDPVATSDLKIVTVVSGTLTNGGTVNHATDGGLDYTIAANNFATSQENGVWPASHFTSNDGYPCKVDSAGACLSDGSGRWGNTTFMNGDILTTNINVPASLQSILGTATLAPYSLSLPNNMNAVTVTVEIVHVPSNRVISSSKLVYT